MIVTIQLNTWSIKPCNQEIKYVKGTEGQDLDDWLIKLNNNHCKSVQTSCFSCQQQTENEPNKIKFNYGRKKCAQT